MKADLAKAAVFMLEEIETYMRSDDFQRDFFESLNDQFTDKGHLSEKQMESLTKIYERVTT